MFGAILGGLLHSVEFPLVFTLYADESCDGDGGSLDVPEVNIGEASTRRCMYQIYRRCQYIFIARL